MKTTATSVKEYLAGLGTLGRDGLPLPAHRP